MGQETKTYQHFKFAFVLCATSRTVNHRFLITVIGATPTEGALPSSFATEHLVSALQQRKGGVDQNDCLLSEKVKSRLTLLPSVRKEEKEC